MKMEMLYVGRSIMAEARKQEQDMPCAPISALSIEDLQVVRMQTVDI